MTGLHVQLCGPMVVQAGSERIEAKLPGRQGRLVLGYLVVNDDRPVPRDELLTAAWGEQVPAGDVLSPLLSKLRKAIGADHIQGRTELRFAGGEGCFVDLRWALEAVHRAEGFIAHNDWAAAWAPSHTAYHIAKRRFMLGLEAPWIEPWRHRMDGVFERALVLFARSALGLGGQALMHAEGAARTLIEKAPFNETAYRILMETLDAMGNRAGALMEYERLRTLLREELGIDPSPSVQEVHLRLLG